MAGSMTAKKIEKEQDVRFRKLLNQLFGYINKNLPDKFSQFKTTLGADLPPAYIATDNFLTICDTLITKGKIAPKKLKLLKKAINKDLDDKAYRFILQAEKDMIEIEKGTYVEERESNSSDEEETETGTPETVPGNRTDVLKSEKEVLVKEKTKGNKSTSEDEKPSSNDDKPKVADFHKLTDTTTSVEDMRVHFQESAFVDSIGLLKVRESGSNSHGTCFRVGNQRHVMTAYHVIRDAIDYMIQQIANRIVFSSDDDNVVKHIADTLKVSTSNINMRDEAKALEQILRSFLDISLPELNFSNLLNQLQTVIPPDIFDRIMKLVEGNLWIKACIVKFEKQETEHSFECDIPFVDKRNDVIILKVAGNAELPKPVILDPAEPNGQVMIFGYPGETRELQMDIRCPVYSCRDDLDKDIKKAVDWWMTQSHSKEQEFFEFYYNVENKIILHTSKSFVEGASGGPLTKADRIIKQPLVCIMYQGGFPHFYYDSKEGEQLYQYKDVPGNMLFEVGISMKMLGDLLRNAGKETLRKDLFSVK